MKKKNNFPNWKSLLENWSKYLNNDLLDIEDIELEPGWLKFTFENKEISYETRERYVSRVYMPDHYKNDRVVIKTNPNPAVPYKNYYEYTSYIGIDRIIILELIDDDLIDQFLYEDGEIYLYSEAKKDNGDDEGFIKYKYPIKFDLDLKEVEKLSRVVTGVFTHFNQG